MADNAPPELDPLEVAFRKISDGGTLKTVEGGLQIIRRKKHEPINLEGLSREQRIRRTSKIYGSKFASAWNLVKYVEHIELRVKELKWTAATGAASDRLHLAEPVGISNGVQVHTIRMISDGRFVHAYPDKDDQ
jgi:hypothetical protein